jgi:hypothetical protein
MDMNNQRIEAGGDSLPQGGATRTLFPGRAASNLQVSELFLHPSLKSMTYAFTTRAPEIREGGTGLAINKDRSHNAASQGRLDKWQK